MLKLFPSREMVIRNLDIVKGVLNCFAIAGHGSKRGGPVRNDFLASIDGSSSSGGDEKGSRLSLIRPALYKERYASNAASFFAVFSVR